jgi:hypothetical protein
MVLNNLTPPGHSIAKQPILGLYQVSKSPLHPHRLVRLVHHLLNKVRLGIQGSLLLLELLVEVGKHKTEDEAADDGNAKHGRHDTVALAEPIRWEIPDVRAGNITKLTKCVDHCDCNGALSRWARER